MDQRSVKLFFEKVNKDAPGGCWEWMGCLQKNGYGQVTIARKKWRAHRASWVICNGEIPAGPGFHGTCVCHRCDNKSCVNPDHLFLASQQENVADMMRKGRRKPTIGINSTRAKLNDCDIREIRRLWVGSGITKTEIGRRFGVTYWAIREILNGNNWRHVK